MEQGFKAAVAWAESLLLMWSLFQFWFGLLWGSHGKRYLGRNQQFWFEVSGHARNYRFLKGLNFLNMVDFRDSESRQHEQRLMEQGFKAAVAWAELFATNAVPFPILVRAAVGRRGLGRNEQFWF